MIYAVEDRARWVGERVVFCAARNRSRRRRDRSVEEPLRPL
jgi:hypothetical protein